MKVSKQPDASTEKKKKKKPVFCLHLVIEKQRCDMFKHMEVIGIDYIEFFRSNKYQVKVSNAGIVTFCFVENFPTSHHTE